MNAIIFAQDALTHAIKTTYDNCPLKTLSAPFLEKIILDQVKRALTNVEWVKWMV